MNNKSTIKEKKQVSNDKNKRIQKVVELLYSKLAIVFYTILFVVVFGKGFIEKVGLFQNFKGSTTADILFFVGLILVGYRYYYLFQVERYILPKRFSNVVLITGFLYTILRFFLTEDWELVYLVCLGSKSIAYLDFIYVFVFCELVFGAVKFFDKRSLSDDKGQVSFFKVESDNGTLKDNFGRENMAFFLASNIFETNIKDSSLVIGIVGGWGSGKTWFLTRVKKLYSGIDKDSIILDFNSWISDGRNGLIIGFFRMLSSELDKYNGNLSSQISRYLTLITKKDSSGISSFLIDEYYGVESLENSMKKIGSAVGEINRRVIIVVDDLDRLGRNEILEVMQILRMTSTYKNVVFLVGYDREYLNEAIKHLNAHQYERYLDKIFQIQLSLPAHPDNFLIDKLRNDLNDIVSNAVEDDSLKKFYLDSVSALFSFKFNSVKDVIARYLVTQRDLDVLLNGLKFKLLYLKDQQIVLADLILIEILQLTDYGWYNVLANKRNRNLIRYPSATSESKKVYYSNENAQSVNSTTRGLLDTLFNIDKGDRAVSDIFYYELYFGYLGRIPLFIFNKLVGSEFGQLKEQVERWIEEGHEDEIWAIINRYEVYRDKREVENIFRLIMTLATKDKNKSNEILDNKLRVEKQFENILSVYEKREDDFLEMIFPIAIEYKEVGFYSYLSNIAREGIDVEKIFDFGTKYFSKLVEQNSEYNLIESVVVFSYEKESNEDGGLIINSKILELFREYISNKPDGFVKNNIRKYHISIPEFETHNIFPFTKQLFGSYDEFEKYLESLPETFNLIELKTFYRRFKINNYQPIKFERGTIEYVSDDKNKFIKSDFFHKEGPIKSASSYIHPWHNGLIKIDRNFNGLKWIAKEPEITNMEEVRKGDCYYFERIVDIDDKTSIKRAKIKFMVDDLLSIKLNGRFICEKINTADTKVHSVDIDVEYFQEKNTFEFHIINYEGLAAKHPSENPYGLIYILELTFDIGATENVDTTPMN